MIRRFIGALLLAAVASLTMAAPAEAGFWRLRGASAAPPVTFIVPGPGWGGATTQPANQGDPSAFGYNDLAVGYWDTPQFITATGDLHVGIFADHVNDTTGHVDHVDIACDGGPWVTIASPTTNPDRPGLDVPTTYNAVLKASAFTDDQHECRGILWPTTGKPFVLQGAWDLFQPASIIPASIQSLWINTNAGGGMLNPSWAGGLRQVKSTGSDTSTCGLTSAAPCLTAYGAARAEAAIAPGNDIGGMTICFQEGSGYSLGGSAVNFITRSAKQYVLITNCAGADPANIHFASNSNIRTDRVHYKSLILQSAPGGTDINIDCGNVGTGFAPIAWVDGVTYQGPGRTTGSGPFGTGCRGGRFISNSEFLDTGNGPTSSNWIWGLSLHHLGSDAVSNVPWVMGLVVHDIDTEYHANGDTTLGSPLITNITDMSLLYVGSHIHGPNIYGSDSNAPVTIICRVGSGACASDPPNSLRVDANAKGTAVGQALATGAHGDVDQINTNDNSLMRRNIGFVNVTAVENIEAQGQFLSTGQVSDFATINVKLNNQSHPNTERVWLYATTMNNAYVKDSTYVGGMNYAGAPGDFVTTGFSWINDTFSGCPENLNSSPANPPSYLVTAVSKTNPAVVTTSTAHGLLTGDGVSASTQFAGMTQLDRNRYKVTVLSPTTFSLQDINGGNIDSTAYSTYSSGGHIAGPLSPHGVRYVGTSPKCY